MKRALNDSDQSNSLLAMMKVVWQSILNLVFPIYLNCGLCGDHLSEESFYCEPCLRGQLSREDATCTKCGRLLPVDKRYFENYKGRCEICQTSFYYFNRHVSFTLYEGRAKAMLLNLKYKGDLQYVPIIAEGMYHAIKDNGLEKDFDFILPVPIHWKRRLTRGFNQSEEYASSLSDFFPGTSVLKALKRQKHTKKLKNLSKDARKKMLDNVIIVERERLSVLKGKRVLLVDDIYTTGSTLNACAKALYESGVESIIAVTFAMGI